MSRWERHLYDVVCDRCRVATACGFNEPPTMAEACGRAAAAGWIVTDAEDVCPECVERAANDGEAQP